MFDNYPKKRLKLPQKYKDIYEAHYKSNREGQTVASGLAQKMESWLHKKVARDVSFNHQKRTLEIGAGTLNQLKYEQSQHYDVIEPFTKLYKNSPYIDKVNDFFEDIDDVPFTNRYDRITSVATFEDITDLPKIVAKTCLLMVDGGCLRTSIPNEGTFLWKFAYNMTTGIEFRLKYGLVYNLLMRYEHVNTANEIEDVLSYFFKINKCSSFGLNKNFALYRFYESREPNIERAKKYLSEYKS